MIPQELQQLITDCNSNAELDIATKSINYIYRNYEELRKEAYNIIKQRKAQIEICGAKGELINNTKN